MTFEMNPMWNNLQFQNGFSQINTSGMKPLWDPSYFMNNYNFQPQTMPWGNFNNSWGIFNNNFNNLGSSSSVVKEDNKLPERYITEDSDQKLAFLEEKNKYIVEQKELLKANEESIETLNKLKEYGKKPYRL